MKKIMNPPLCLLALIIGQTQLLETIYSPALPSISKEFAVDAYLEEHTLTIYLFGLQ